MVLHEQYVTRRNVEGRNDHLALRLRNSPAFALNAAALDSVCDLSKNEQIGPELVVLRLLYEKAAALKVMRH